MKKIIYLLTALLFVGCTPDHHDPLPVFIEESATITFADQTKLHFGSNANTKNTWDESDANTEYYYQREFKGNDEILTIFARSKKYSDELNPELKELLKNHVPANQIPRIVFSDKSFYKVYQIQVNEKVVFENNEALSDTVWGNDLNYSNYLSSLNVTLNEDYTVESSTYKP